MTNERENRLILGLLMLPNGLDAALLQKFRVFASSILWVYFIRNCPASGAFRGEGIRKQMPFPQILYVMSDL